MASSAPRRDKSDIHLLSRKLELAAVDADEEEDGDLFISAVFLLVLPRPSPFRVTFPVNWSLLALFLLLWWPPRLLVISIG